MFYYGLLYCHTHPTPIFDHTIRHVGLRSRLARYGLFTLVLLHPRSALEANRLSSDEAFAQDLRIELHVPRCELPQRVRDRNSATPLISSDWGKNDLQ